MKLVQADGIVVYFMNMEIGINSRSKKDVNLFSNYSEIVKCGISGISTSMASDLANCFNKIEMVRLAYHEKYLLKNNFYVTLVPDAYSLGSCGFVFENDFNKIAVFVHYSNGKYFREAFSESVTKAVFFNTLEENMSRQPMETILIINKLDPSLIPLMIEGNYKYFYWKNLGRIISIVESASSWLGKHFMKKKIDAFRAEFESKHRPIVIQDDPILKYWELDEPASIGPCENMQCKMLKYDFRLSRRRILQIYPEAVFPGPMLEIANMDSHKMIFLQEDSTLSAPLPRVNVNGVEVNHFSRELDENNRLLLSKRPIEETIFELKEDVDQTKLPPFATIVEGDIPEVILEYSTSNMNSRKSEFFEIVKR